MRESLRLDYCRTAQDEEEIGAQARARARAGARARALPLPRWTSYLPSSSRYWARAASFSWGGSSSPLVPRATRPHPCLNPSRNPNLILTLTLTLSIAFILTLAPTRPPSRRCGATSSGRTVTRTSTLSGCRICRRPRWRRRRRTGTRRWPPGCSNAARRSMRPTATGGRPSGKEASSE